MSSCKTACTVGFLLTISAMAHGLDSPEITVFLDWGAGTCAPDGLGFSPDGTRVWVVQNQGMLEGGGTRPGVIEVYDLDGKLVSREETKFQGEDVWELQGLLFVSENEIIADTGNVWRKEKGEWSWTGCLKLPDPEMDTQTRVLMPIPGKPGSFLVLINRWIYSASTNNDPANLGSVFFYGPWMPTPVPDVPRRGAPVEPRPPENQPLDSSEFHVRTNGIDGLICYPRGFWEHKYHRFSREGLWELQPEIDYTVRCRSFDRTAGGNVACLVKKKSTLLWTRIADVERSVPIPPDSCEIHWLPSGRILVQAFNGTPCLYIADPVTGKVSEPLILAGSVQWIRIHPATGAILGRMGNWFDMNRWFLAREAEGDLRLEIVRVSRSYSAVTCIVPDDQGNRVIAMHENGEIRVLDQNTGTQNSGMQAAAYFGDYEKQRDLFTGEPVDTHEIDEPVDNRWYSLASSPDGKVLIAGSHPGCLDIIDVENPKRHTYRYLGGFRINGIRFLGGAEEGYRVAIFNRSWALRVVDIRRGKGGFDVNLVREIAGNFGYAYGMDVCSEDSRFGAIASSFWRGIRAVDFSTGTMRFVGDVPGPGHGVSAIPGSKQMLGAYNTDKRELAVIRFDPETGSIVWKSEGTGMMGYGALVSSDKYWAACENTKKLRVGRTGEAGDIRIVAMPDSPPDECSQCMAFLKDGRTLLIGTSDGRILKVVFR